jgi:NTP pyrophosphatase (non-canonical NTP hydrolase)
MRFAELQQAAKIENERLRAHFDLADNKLHVLAQMAKLSEETSELANEILARYGFQRASKLEESKRNSVEKELADTMIVLAMLADNMGIDLEKALTDRVEHIRKRDYKE